jgi:hypothetical protein
MALRADVHIQMRFDGHGFERFPAGTFDNGLDSFRMNALFHEYHLSCGVARIPAAGPDTYAAPDSVVAE